MLFCLLGLRRSALFVILRLSENRVFCVLYFALVEMLHFVQNDKLGFVGVLTERAMTFPTRTKLNFQGRAGA